MNLVPCTVCSRHVRQEEKHCPFCGATLALASAPRRESRFIRDRRALLFGAAAVAGSLAVAGCNNSSNAVDGRGAARTENMPAVPPYGVSVPEDMDASPASVPVASLSAAADAGKDASASLPPPAPNYPAVPPYGVPRAEEDPRRR